jgi:hypothetical protein
MIEFTMSLSFSLRAFTAFFRETLACNENHQYVVPPQNFTEVSNLSHDELDVFALEA